MTADGDVTADSASIIIGGAGDDAITGSNGNDVIIGGAGDDTLNGHFVGLADDDVVVGVNDDDTFLWRAGASGFDDGQDFIDGGGEGADGDTFQVIGNGSSETYRVYTETEAVARGFALAGEEPEIFVTRQVGNGEETVIAQLIDIEEIVINGNGVSGDADLGNGDRVEMYGDFSVTTSLRPDTITIIGSEGDDTVDISALRSAHRILFKTGGGNDTIVGTLRPQDVIELAPGLTVNDYEKIDNQNGSFTLKSDTHSITYVSAGDPILRDGDDDDDHDDDDNDGGGEQEGPVNKKPIVTDEHYTIKKGEALRVTAAQLLANDFDLDNGDLSIVGIDEDEHGTAALQPGRRHHLHAQGRLHRRGLLHLPGGGWPGRL